MNAATCAAGPLSATMQGVPCRWAGAPATSCSPACMWPQAPPCAQTAAHQTAAGGETSASVHYAALDASPVPVVLCRRTLDVVHANPAAHHAIAEGAGFAIVRGRICALAPDAHAWLARAVASAIGNDDDRERIGPRARMLAPVGLGPSVLAVVVAQPRAAPGAGDAPDATVIMHCPEPRLGPTAAVLGAAFGLTDGEIRVLGALIAGGALTAVARRLRVGHETVRSHLKSIFAKTGTHRQGDLLALVLTLSSLPWPRR